MNIIQAWKDSLTLFMPNNMKLFVLIVLKTIIETYKLLFRYFWWYFAGMFTINLIFRNQFISDYFYSDTWSLWNLALSFVYLVVFILHPLFYFMIITLASRPSVEQKDLTYFIKNFSLLPQVFCCGVLSVYIVSVLFGLFALLNYYFLKFFPLSQTFDFFNIFLYFSTLLYIFYFVTLLFLFDTKKYFHSVYLAMKMIILNMPIFFSLCVLYQCVQTIIDAILVWVPFFAIDLQMCMSYLLSSIFCVLISTIYIKRLYEQYDMYCKQA